VIFLVIRGGPAPMPTTLTSSNCAPVKIPWPRWIIPNRTAGERSLRRQQPYRSAGSRVFIAGRGIRLTTSISGRARAVESTLNALIRERRPGRRHQRGG